MTVNQLISFLERYKELFDGNDRVIASDDVHDEGWFPVIDVHADRPSAAWKNPKPCGLFQDTYLCLSMGYGTGGRLR